MPTYQYKCKACEHRFDVVQKITDESLTVCPECGGEIRRVLFPAGVVFKGSGWYVTDYRNSGEKAKYEAESKGESTPAASDGKSDAKSDTKTETKAETKTETKSESPTAGSPGSKPETKAA